MKTGIFIVSYGKEYDRCASYTMFYSRKNTDLPIYVYTNLDENERSEKWKEVENVQFEYKKDSVDNNRIPKLSMPELTPFEYTIHVDVDSIIQNKGIEIFPELLKDNDLALRRSDIVEPGRKIVRIYSRCMKQFGVKKPIAIHNGGIIAFKKTDKIKEFFKLWYKIWNEFGHGREMPPLNCAVKLSGIGVSLFPKDFFSDIKNPDAIVQHNYGHEVWVKEQGIPWWNSHHPFDKKGNDDFNQETEEMMKYTE